MSDNLFQNYIKEIYKLINQGDTREESFYNTLADLIKSYGKSLNKKTEVTVLPKKSEAGNPDFRVWDGESVIIGYIEAKHPSKRNLEDVENSEQLKRYREAYPNLILTNFLEFRVYRNGEYLKGVKIGDYKLSKAVPEYPVITRKKEFIELLNLFFDFTQPKIKTTKVLSEILAKKAKIMRDFIILPSLTTNPVSVEETKAYNYFFNLYNSFKTYLLKDLGHDDFADLFAQTFTYGLFIAKYQFETQKTASIPFRTKTAYAFIQKSFGILQEIFREISTEVLPKNLEIIVDDIVNILNHTDLFKILNEYKEDNKGDPIYHLYETFLATYDPEKRKKLGVYYTPLPVVSFIVNSINSLLKDHNLFHAPDGLATYQTDSIENSVTLLDPAVGTGTFFVEAIDKAIEEIKKKYSESKDFINQFIRNHILKHFFAFEILIAPYVICHLKTLFNLIDKHHFIFKEEDKLNIFLTNTLEFHRRETGSGHIGLFEKILLKEQEEALKVKKQTPILIIIGNPPYSVSSQNKVDPETDFGKFYESYKENVRKEEKNIQPLSDDYIKFLAFAHWKIKHTGRGIIGMITNNSYLDGLIHRDMRKKLYEDFDLIYILNLHGDAKRPKITKDGKKDENVFNIKQGVAIGIFVKASKRITSKQVFYQELIGSREEKYRFLNSHDISNIQGEKLEPREPYWFFVPKKFDEDVKYKKFIKLNEIFIENRNGITTGQDKFFTDFNKDSLKVRILAIFNLSNEEDSLIEMYNLKSQAARKLLKNRKSCNYKEELLAPYAYRPFDNRWIYNENKFLWRSVEWLGQQFQFKNIALAVTKILSGEKFNHAFISDKIGDYCYLSDKTKEFAIFFPLWLYNSKNKAQAQLFSPAQLEPKNSNIKKEIIDSLLSSYKKPVSPEEIFYYIYTILYSNIYRQKYLEFLKIDFPRMPFTSNYEIFKKLSQLGQILVELHLLKSPLLEKSSSRFEGEGKLNLVKKVNYDPQGNKVYINESQFFTNIEPEVWNYFIGSYQVLNKWLKDRKGRYLTDEEIKTYIKIVESLRQTIRIQIEIDKLYPSVEEDLINFKK